MLAVAAAAGAVVGGTLLILPQQSAPPRPPSASHGAESATVAPAEAAARTQAIEELLRRRADALRARDETAFMASVDPRAPAEFRRAQRDLFHNLAEVPFASWSYQIERPEPVARSFESGTESWAPRVNLSYSLDGVDVVPTVRPLNYRFALRSGSWFVTTPGVPDRGVWQGPWHFGACRVVRLNSGLIVGHESNRPLAERVAPMVEAARDVVTEVWGPDWSQRVGVFIPESRPELLAMVGSEFAVDGIAAVAVADRVDARQRLVEGPRIVLNPDTANGLSDAALRVVIQHEITHLAARADTAVGAPMWMLEGFADHVGYRGSDYTTYQIAPDLARQVRTTGPPTSLPTAAAFHRTGRDLDLAYQQAWSAVDFLVRQVGEQRVVELYRRIAAPTANGRAVGADPTRAGASATDAAFREVTGMSEAEFLARWSAELRASLG